MRTLEKAFSLLDTFSHAKPSRRLAEIADEANIDRSTAHRMLKTMVEYGYLVHRRDTRRYELGASVLRLALTREANVSTADHYRDLVQDLTQKTQESAHVSLRAGRNLATIAAAQGVLANRVAHEAGAILQPHATASGLAYLAYCSEDFRAECLKGPLNQYSQTTPRDGAELQKRLDAVRLAGFSRANGTFDAEVFSIGAPIFGHDELAVGAVAVATPLSRMTPDLELLITKATVAAALRATTLEGGRVPTFYLSSIRNYLQ